MHQEKGLSMFALQIGAPELIGRAVLVYVAIFVLLRIVGKKHVGEMAPFDLVVLLILSECVQGALTAGDNSVTAGVIAAATLFGTNQLVGYVSSRNKPVERVLEGRPRILVRNGTVCKDVLAREQVSHSELIEALRKEGCTSLTRVRYAILENDGQISIGLRGR
jgi:uncharacterized membrane protein YcaP (DUF421 family)